MMNEPLITGQL